MALIKKDYNRLNITNEQVWQALGRKNQPVNKALEAGTKEMVDLALKLAKPASVYEIGELKREDGKLEFYDLTLSGKDLPAFLETSNRAILLAVTLGHEIDRQIRILESADLTKALLLDATASILTEEVCNTLTRDLEVKLGKENKFITERFSPGYGDCPLELQPGILKLLDTPRKIGLTSSRTNLLIPRKSVTAFIGIMDKPRAPKYNRCRHCRLRSECKYGLCAYKT